MRVERAIFTRSTVSVPVFLMTISFALAHSVSLRYAPRPGTHTLRTWQLTRLTPNKKSQQFWPDLPAAKCKVPAGKRVCAAIFLSHCIYKQIQRVVSIGKTKWFCRFRRSEDLPTRRPTREAVVTEL